MDRSDRILITGATGLLGSALLEALSHDGFSEILPLSSGQLDLTDRAKTADVFKDYRPQWVFHLAGAVFGLGGNLKDPAHTYLMNTLINTHVVEAAAFSGAKKILGMGSICAYPGHLTEETSIDESMLFQGVPHPGEAAYGASKRGLLVHLQASAATHGIDYAYVLSTNLYGPRDRFNTENGHVIPSLIKKFYLAKKDDKPVTIWGDGQSKRDFMFSADAARALIRVMESWSGPINMATGTMVKISDVVDILAEHTGRRHFVNYDRSKPRGHEFGGFDVSKLRSIGFEPRCDLDRGLIETFDWYSDNAARARQ